MGAIGKYPTHPERFPLLFSLLLRLCCGLCATSVNDETSPAFGFQTFLSQIFISPFKPSVFRIYMVCVSNQPVKPTAGEHSQRVFALCSAKSSQLRARPTLPCLTHGLPCGRARFTPPRLCLDPPTTQPFLQNSVASYPMCVCVDISTQSPRFSVSNLLRYAAVGICWHRRADAQPYPLSTFHQSRNPHAFLP